MGEMIMLMLGEGMLSLVISDTLLDSAVYEGPGGWECDAQCWAEKAESGVSFASGFLTLASLMWSYFRANRFTRHHHAVRRSSTRGIAWNTSHWPLAVALIGAGVCIKAIHPDAARALPKREVVMAYGLLLAFSIVLMAFQQLMHPGIVAFVMAPRERSRRLGLFSMRICCAAALIGMVAFPVDTRGFVYMVHSCIFSVLSAIILVLEKNPAIERGLWYYADHIETDHHYHERQERGVGSRKNTMDHIVAEAASGPVHRHQRTGGEEVGPAPSSSMPDPEHPYLHRRHHTSDRLVGPGVVDAEEVDVSLVPADGRVPAWSRPASLGASKPVSRARTPSGSRTPTGAMSRGSPQGRRQVMTGSGGGSSPVRIRHMASLPATRPTPIDTGSEEERAVSEPAHSQGSDSESDADSVLSDVAPVSRQHVVEEFEDELTEDEDMTTAVVLTG
mmetsp:Transcript_3999/g.11301  ORF Transcript_3999/g.11301 Transcript_3999/m.11301 type:complete len:447 (+) Transcript_3999:39-1379(+)